MEAKIKILGGKSAGQEIAVAETGLLIGRSNECQLRPKSEFVSRQHANISIDEARLMIQDLGSRTGTYVNGHLIPPQRAVQLENGDAVRIGPIEFGVVITHALARQKKPKVESIEEAAGRAAERTVEQSGGDVDVTQWLKPSDSEMALGETIEAGPQGGSVLDAAAFLNAEEAESQDQASSKSAKPAPGGARPDQVASDALKNYMRRR